MSASCTLLTITSLLCVHNGRSSTTVNHVKAMSMSNRTAVEIMREMARNSTFSYEQVNVLSNNIGPRLSGSPQAAAAVRYVAKKMGEMGLDVRLEPVTVRHWVRGQEEADLIRYPRQVDGTDHRIVVTALGNTVPTPDVGITAPIVLVNNFEELEQLPVDHVRSNVVFFNFPFDRFAARAGRWEQAYGAAVPYRSHGAARAAKKGAAAVLVRSAGSGMLRLAHTGVTKYEEGIPQIPAGAVPAEDGDLISGLAKQGPVEIHLLLTPKEFAPEQSHNVVADLKGEQFPEQIVIVSAHLDSWDLGTGALDDAVGIGIAMDVVRIIKSVCSRPKRTIRFVAWMNEENGGAGGLTYTSDHAAELHDHVAAIEIDYGDGRPLSLIVAGTDERLAPISDVLRTSADGLLDVVRVNDSPGVDLRTMNKKGVPAIAPLQDGRYYFDYHHTAADTFDKVRINEVRRVVELLVPVVYGIAQHD